MVAVNDQNGDAGSTELIKRLEARIAELESWRRDSEHAARKPKAPSDSKVKRNNDLKDINKKIRNAIKNDVHRQLTTPADIADAAGTAESTTRAILKYYGQYKGNEVVRKTHEMWVRHILPRGGND